jgi:hypothetical protein
MAFHGAKLASAGPDESGAGVVFPITICRNRTSDASVALTFACASIQRSSRSGKGRDRFHRTLREERTAFPIRDAFPRQVPFSGLHQSRGLATATWIPTSFHPPRLPAAG